MILFNELRIGSWLLEDGRTIRVNAIEFGNEPYCRVNETIASKKDVAEIFEAIPITEGFLKSVGFNAAQDSQHLRLQLPSGDYLVYSMEDKTFELNEKQLPQSPAFIHQFQNMYLCLAGQELDIKL